MINRRKADSYAREIVSGNGPAAKAKRAKAVEVMRRYARQVTERTLMEADKRASKEDYNKIVITPINTP